MVNMAEKWTNQQEIFICVANLTSRKAVYRRKEEENPHETNAVYPADAHACAVRGAG